MKKRFEYGKGYDYHIPWGMLFKRMHCCKCGKKLSINYISLGCDPDKKWRKRGFLSGGTLGFRYRYLPKGIESFEAVYKCKNCDYIISYETQKNIRKYQDAGHRHILTDKEIDCYNLIPKYRNLENKGEKL